MSTVGGLQPFGALPETSLEIQLEGSEPIISKIWSADTHGRTKREGILSPPAINEESLVTETTRSSSPSDAILMPRSIQRLDQANNPGLVIGKDIRPSLGHLAPVDFSRVHKRAISAPNFAGPDTIDRSFPPPLPLTLQPNPLPSHRGDPRSAYAMETTSPPPLPAPANQPPQASGIFCMYKPNCDTGSQLRKAISHIFGRNKTCTRNIPPHAWVHFCRKHYQRSRYRNAQEWARVQCDLVQKQIRRVQEWSDENKRTGKPGLVQDWSLSMRKREQNRVQERSNKKRSYRDDSEDDDDDVLDSATLNGTAVPDWLRSKCGDGYSTAEIEEIVVRLKQEMEETNMTQIPDIEILPNISMDTSDLAKPKALLKRKTSTGNSTHKRSQSVGVALRHEPQPMTRRISQPSHWRPEDSMRPSPVDKRQRVSDTPPYDDRHTLSERPPLAPLRPMYSLPHRPAFGNIQESRAEESYYNDGDIRAHNYGYDYWPGPTSQRTGGQPAAAARDSGISHDYLDSRRAPHQRSLSEVDGFQQGFTFRPFDYPSMPTSYLAEPAHYDRGTIPSGHPQTPSTTLYYDDRSAPAQRSFPPPHQPSTWSSPLSAPGPPYPGHRHTRHQSTPSAPHGSMPSASTPAHEHAGGTPPITSYEQSPPYHRRQRSYAPSRQYPYRPSVQESDQAKAVFSERR
ncbi:hypothetical protein AAE478_006626 [Parahypoxylon ruwenzoriense]